MDVQTDACFDGMGFFMQVIGLMFTLHQPYLIYRTCIYSYFQIGSQFGSASPWCVDICRWRVDGDCRLSYWLNFAVAVRRIEWWLDCMNIRPALSQWERRWSLSSMWNYVSTRKQQNTLQLTTIKKIAVTQKETLAVVMAAEHWAPAWSNRHVIIHCDNQAAVSIINKGSTPNAVRMPYLRRLFWLSACFNFRVTARYIPGHSKLYCRCFILYAWQPFSSHCFCLFMPGFSHCLWFCTVANASYALQ